MRNGSHPPIGRQSSDKFRVFPRARNRLGESLAFQRREVFFNAHGRLLQTLTLSLGCCADDVRSKVELVREEVVGMLCLDAIRLENSLGKVFEVEGHNKIGPAADGSGQDVT